LVEFVRDQLLDAAADQRPVADLSIVHEHPAAGPEGMAIRPGGRRAGRGADMGKEQRRADVPVKMLQVLVGPGRAHLTIEAGLVALDVPADGEASAVPGCARSALLE